MTIFQILVYFPLYAFLGWCLEVTYQAVSKGIVVNRGFLNGPICPIYGFGVIASVLLVQTFFHASLRSIPAFTIFIFGIVVSTLIELIGGWLLDKLFHARWWDYRDCRFNLNGYICLEFSLYWGLGMVFVLHEVFPFFARVLRHTFIHQSTASYVALACIYLIMAVDVTVSVLIVAGVDKKFREIDELQKKLRRISDELSTRIGEETLERKENVDERILVTKFELEKSKEELEERIEERREGLSKILARHKIVGAGRIIRAYPDIVHKNSNEVLQDIKKYIMNTPKY